MRAQSWLLTVLTVAPLAAAGCGDDNNGTTTDATGTDTSTNETTTGDTTSPTGDTTPNETVSCGNRVCGTFAGLNCGTCDPGEICTSAGQCESAGNPMGSFCGITANCTPDSLNYPDCIDNQCASRNCLSLNPTALVLRDVCSSGCQIHKDNNPPNGVNDVDAPLDDCNPDDIVDGPAGNAFRCVNFAAPGASPVGLCVPGSEFVECQSDADCPSGEGCELTTIGGDYNFRCVANYEDNASWNADVVGLAGSCNDDPANGDVSYCKSGLCFGLGCVTACERASDCNTDTCNTGTGKCNGDASVTCASDADCSAWECGEARQILGDGQGGLAGPFWKFCWPKSCSLDDDCGSNFYCRFFWNGDEVNPGLDNLCLRQNPDGVDRGEACDPNPDDNIPGAVCKNEDLCIGGFCSNLCNTDANCGTDQVCAVAELPGDLDDDGEDEFVLPVKWCQTYPNATDECRSNKDCGTGEACQIYEIENPNQAGQADAMYLLAGLCQNVAAEFPGTAGDFGATCASGAECKSGFCLGATDTTPGFCTTVCAASADCGTVTIQGETYNGICASLLYGYGGTLDDSTDVVYIPLCIVTTDSLVDCASNLTCTAANEVCFHNVVATDAAHPATTEFLCSALVEEGTAKPTGALGSACNLEPAEDDPPQCASGYCIEDKNGNGYCSQLCKAGDPCGAGTTCVETTVFPRVGVYADNSASIGLCRKDGECEACYGNFNCSGGDVCANLGTSNVPDYRCVPGCVDSCEAANATCNAGTDARGEANNGCFQKNGAVPVNYCAQ